MNIVNKNPRFSYEVTESSVVSILYIVHGCLPVQAKIQPHSIEITESGPDATNSQRIHFGYVSFFSHLFHTNANSANAIKPEPIMTMALNKIWT
jgi:hypothetical protein